MSIAAGQGENPGGDKNGGNNSPSQIGTPKRKRSFSTCSVCGKTFSSVLAHLRHKCLSSSPQDAHSAVEGKEDSDEKRENARAVKGRKSLSTQEEERENNHVGRQDCGESDNDAECSSARSLPEEEEVAEILKNLKMQSPKKKKYICHVCGREFDCWQALGGHKRAHSRAHPSRSGTRHGIPPRRPPEDSGGAGSSIVRFQQGFNFLQPTLPETGPRQARLPPPEAARGVGSSMARPNSPEWQSFGSRLEGEGQDLSSPAQPEDGGGGGSITEGCASSELPCLKSRPDSGGLDLNLPPPPEDADDEVDNGKC